MTDRFPGLQVWDDDTESSSFHPAILTPNTTTSVLSQPQQQPPQSTTNNNNNNNNNGIACFYYHPPTPSNKKSSFVSSNHHWNTTTTTTSSSSCVVEGWSSPWQPPQGLETTMTTTTSTTTTTTTTMTTANMNTTTTTTTSSIENGTSRLEEYQQLRLLQEETSSWKDVAQACHSCLNNNRNSRQNNNTNVGVTSSKRMLYHQQQHNDNTNTNSSSTSSRRMKWIPALTVCAKYHVDSRCRILACRTAVLLIHQEEGDEEDDDEMAKNDVLQLLLHVALEDTSNVVCAMALQACHSLLYSTTTAITTAEEEEDMPGPYSPYYASSTHPSILEWQERQHNFVVLPRLHRLIIRVSLFSSSHPSLAYPTCPFFTSALWLLLLSSSSSSSSVVVGVSKEVHAKRGCFQTSSLLPMYQQHILVPLLSSSSSSLQPQQQWNVLHHYLQFPNPSLTILRSYCGGGCGPFSLDDSTNHNHHHHHCCYSNNPQKMISSSSSTLLLALHYLPMKERLSSLNAFVSQFQQQHQHQHQLLPSLQVRANQSQLSAALHLFHPPKQQHLQHLQQNNKKKNHSSRSRSRLVIPSQMKIIVQIVTLLFLPQPNPSILSSFTFPIPNNTNNLDWIMTFCTVALHIGQHHTNYSSSSWQSCALEILLPLSTHLVLTPSNNNNNNNNLPNSIMVQQPYLQLLLVLMKSMGYPCYFSQHVISSQEKKTSSSSSSTTFPASFVGVTEEEEVPNHKKKLSILIWNILMEQIVPKLIASHVPILSFVTIMTDYWIHECMSTIYHHFLHPTPSSSSQTPKQQQQQHQHPPHNPKNDSHSHCSNSSRRRHNGDNDKQQQQQQRKNHPSLLTSSMEEEEEEDGPVDTDAVILPNFQEEKVQRILAFLTDQQPHNFLSIAQIETIGRMALEWKQCCRSNPNNTHNDNDDDNEDDEDVTEIHAIYKVCHTLLQGQGNSSQTISLTKISTTDLLINKQCLEAADRLQNYYSSSTTNMNITNISSYYSPLLDSPFLNQNTNPRSQHSFLFSSLFLFQPSQTKTNNNNINNNINKTLRSIPKKMKKKDEYVALLPDDDDDEETLNHRDDDDGTNKKDHWLLTCPPLFVDDDYKYAYLYQLRRQILLLHLEKAFLQSPFRSLLLGHNNNNKNKNKDSSSSTVTTNDDNTNEEGDNDNDDDDDDYSLPSRHHHHKNKVGYHSNVNIRYSSWPTIGEERTKNQWVVQQQKQQALSYSIMSPSDPVQIILTYGTHQQRCGNGRTEMKLGVKIQLINITAVPIPKGIRLDLTVNKHSSHEEQTNEDALFLLRKTNNNSSSSDTRVSMPEKKTHVYKQPIDSGEQLTWEETLGNWPFGYYSLSVTVTFRDVQNEPFPYQPVSITTDIKQQQNEDVTTEDSLDPSVITTTTAAAQDEWNYIHGIQEDDTVDITLVGEPVPISPLIMLHPCPLVFYRDCCGDEIPFQFLWTSMTQRLPSIVLTKAATKVQHHDDDKIRTQFVASSHISKLKVSAKTVSFTGWAFQTWYGHRVFCMLSPKSDDTNQYSLFVRSDNIHILNTIFGNARCRSIFISSLMGGKYSWDAQPSRQPVIKEDSLDSLYSL